jgi:tetratricopeptide (TPR) repeat protein
MTLGQLLESNQYRTTLKYFQKGLELFQKELKTTNDADKHKQLNSSIASAYAAIAEHYMKTDLCDEPNAENICENCLTEAIKHDKDSTDALIQFSNLHILRTRDNQALVYMEDIFNKVTHALETGNTEIIQIDLIDNLAKNYSELERYSKAIKLYDILVGLDDENVNLFNS